MRIYANTVVRALSRHAVWEPGSFVDVGDYGIIRAGCFAKLGSVRDFDISVRFNEAVDDRFELRTGGDETAHMSVASDVVWADGKLKLHWSGGQGLYIASPRAKLRTIEDLWATATEIRQKIRDWKWAWKLVREVRIVEDAVVLLGEQNTLATNLEFSSAVDIVPAQGSLGRGVAAGFALQRYPVAGALFVDLYRVRTLSFGLGMSPPPDEEPFEPFPAIVDLADDDAA
jgi:hypothetical protein